MDYEKKRFDFIYALENTEIVRLPRQRLETFGTTLLHYHLITELMDEVGRSRIRQGKVKAYRPEIITPERFGREILEGFGEEARKYIEWLRSHESDIYILKYGFRITKEEISEQTVSANADLVVEQVCREVDQRQEAMHGVVKGVEDPWEVCLLKLLVEVARFSAPYNARELRKTMPAPREEIEKEFAAAQMDPSRLSRLAAKLKQYDLFEEYEERFFSLVRRHSRG